MDILSFWPTRENINKCIRPEAETDASSVLLSVHQPTKFLKQHYKKRDKVSHKSEDDLLKSFLTPDLPSGTLLIPITGSSGIGKSHIIRWIETQVQGLNDGIKRHIILIPKSSSLKDVLSLILNDLSGQDYDEIRKTLNNAQAELTIDAAKQLLRAQLLVALKLKAESAKNRMNEAVKKGEKRDPKDELISVFAGEMGLPTLPR